MGSLEAVEKALGVVFADKSLLQQALTHSSVHNEIPTFSIPSNERLEFLGDSVLNFTVTQLLYREFPSSSEGDLTRIRAGLISRDTLARLARKLDLGAFLHLGRGEEASGGRGKSSNIANALEAVLGAIFLDQGLELVTRFVSRLFAHDVMAIAQYGIVTDAKSRLQEHTQALFRETPAYRVLSAAGPGHKKRFTVEVTIGNRVLGRGSGDSKLIAEIEAARSAWDILHSQEVT